MRANLTISLAWRLGATLASSLITSIRADRIMQRVNGAQLQLELRDCCDFLRGLPKAERRPILWSMKYVARRELANVDGREARQILRRDLRAAITHARTLATAEAA